MQVEGAYDDNKNNSLNVVEKKGSNIFQKGFGALRSLAAQCDAILKSGN